MIKPGDDAHPDLASIRIYAQASRPRRSRLTAGLLGVLLGAFGAHRFYLGYTRTACTQLALTLATAGLAGVWGVAEGWLILAGKFGCDARGCALTHHSAVRLLAATIGSFTLHVGTTLGAVWWAHYYSAASLIPPPSGVNSVAMAPAAPQEPVAPEQVTLEPPRESEPLPEVEPADPPEPNKPPPLEEITATTVIDAPLTDDADEAPTMDRPKTAETAPPADHAPQLRASANRSQPNNAPSTDQRATSAQASESPPPTVPRTPAEVAPTTSETVAALSSPASVASRESRGFDTDSLPAAVDFRQPTYPPELKQRGITGLVKLRVRVGADGRVKQASVYRTSGYAAFDRAALAAIDDWRFAPARRAGIAVEMEIAVPIRFVLEETKE